MKWHDTELAVASIAVRLGIGSPELQCKHHGSSVTTCTVKPYNYKPTRAYPTGNTSPHGPYRGDIKGILSALQKHEVEIRQPQILPADFKKDYQVIPHQASKNG
jgi:hypothetical protein